MKLAWPRRARRRPPRLERGGIGAEVPERRRASARGQSAHVVVAAPRPSISASRPSSRSRARSGRSAASSAKASAINSSGTGLPAPSLKVCSSRPGRRSSGPHARPARICKPLDNIRVCLEDRLPDIRHRRPHPPDRLSCLGETTVDVRRQGDEQPAPGNLEGVAEALGQRGHLLVGAVGLGVFALEQVAENRCLFRENERPVVARRQGELGRARELASRRGRVREAHRAAEIAARQRGGPLVLDLLRERQRLGCVLLRRREVAHPEGEVGAAFEWRVRATPARGPHRRPASASAPARLPRSDRGDATSHGAPRRSAGRVVVRSTARSRWRPSGSPTRDRGPRATRTGGRSRGEDALLRRGRENDRGGGCAPPAPRRPPPAARARTGAPSRAAGSARPDLARRQSRATGRAAIRAGRAADRARVRHRRRPAQPPRG